jgi:hypothetical protein
MGSVQALLYVLSVKNSLLLGRLLHWGTMLKKSSSFLAQLLPVTILPVLREEEAKATLFPLEGQHSLSRAFLSLSLLELAVTQGTQGIDKTFQKRFGCYMVVYIYDQIFNIPPFHTWPPWPNFS